MGHHISDVVTKHIKFACLSDMESSVAIAF